MTTVRLIWKEKPTATVVTVKNGKLETVEEKGREVFITVSDERTDIGPYATLVQVKGNMGFSFFLRDVKAPVYVPTCNAVVTCAEDTVTYEEITEKILSSGKKSKSQLVEAQEEYDYDRAAKETYELKCPAWLGISKDMRFFQVAVHGGHNGNNEQIYDQIQPRFFSLGPREKELPELEGKIYTIRMHNGRGIGCRNIVSKRLYKGYLPLLEVFDDDDGMCYHTTFFTTLEKQALKSENIRGTDMYAADACGSGYMQTPEHQAYTDSIMDSEYSREEETILYARVTAENRGTSPAYAFTLVPAPLMESEKFYYDAEKGLMRFRMTGRSCAMAKMNGKPMPAAEVSALLVPGETVTFEYMIPHTPLDEERAVAVLNNSFQQRMEEAITFWEKELASGIQIQLPEQRIEEMVKADLIHQDIGYFGKNPNEPVVPIVGVYTAIGSESSPGIQFLDAMGMHELAERAIQYFVEKQRPNGMIQNFAGYMLETGSALWTMGEHWRMTRDVRWLQKVYPAIVKAADFLVDWRSENLTDDLKDGMGYGMIKGKIADPNDYYHSFMLNAGAYAGLYRTAEMLQDIDPVRSREYGRIAAEMKGNIYETLQRSMERSPVVPRGDGCWIRSCPLWPEYTGPTTLYADGGNWYTHGSFVLRDALGACYLILQDAIDPNDLLAREILDYTSEFLAINNVCFSQPYYSPHPYGQLRLGQRKLYLQEFYCGFAGLADRGTYSFWEHHFQASPHKLHEETWFMMRWRWMMAYEIFEEKKLHLMDAVPRKWMQAGKSLVLDGLRTYYGPLCCSIQCEENRITAKILVGAEGFPAPEQVTIRLPHPEGKKATTWSIGEYDAENERFILPSGTVSAELTVTF